MRRLLAGVAAFAPLVVSAVMLHACSSPPEHGSPAPSCTGTGCGAGIGVPPAPPSGNPYGSDAAPDSGPKTLPTTCHGQSGDVAIINGSGDDKVWSGTAVLGGSIAATFALVTDTPDTVTLRATRSDGLSLLYLFSSAKLGSKLEARSYPGAARVDLAGPGVPGFNLEVDGTTCTMTASFVIAAINFDEVSHVRGIEATFSRTCTSVSGTMTGCIKWGDLGGSGADAGVDGGDAAIP